MKTRLQERRGMWPAIRTAIVLATMPAIATGLPPALIRAAPADVAVALFVGRASSESADDASWSAFGAAAMIAEQAYRAGLLSKLDARIRAWVDAALGFSTVRQYPYAVVLFDARGRPRTDGGHELASMRAGLILLTGDDTAPIERRIQHLLSIYTNTEDAALEAKSGAASPTFTLRDQRLPAWASLTWGAYRGYYIIALGDGVYERIVRSIDDRSRGLPHEPWFARAAARIGLERTGDDEFETALYINTEQLRSAADPGLDLKIQWVQSALGLAGVDRALWAVGQEKQSRSIEWVGVTVRSGKDTFRRLAGDQFQNAAIGAVIPEEAGAYAVIDCEPASVWHGISSAFFDAKSPRRRMQSASLLDSIETAANVSIQANVLARLSGPVVVHNYPRHALRLPVAVTIVVPIRDDPKRLADDLDRLLTEVQVRLAETDGVQLHRDPDRVWYLQYGLTGPSLTVVDAHGGLDGWLVLSFSPQAVRQNRTLIQSAVSAGAAPESRR